MSDKYHFIVNTSSKTGEASKIWERVKKYLEDNNIAFVEHITQYGGHAKELADEICSQDGQINLCVLGGDGTLNEVINGMHDFDRVEFGYIPAGSANDFARGVNLKGTPEELIDGIINPTEIQNVDVGVVRYGDNEFHRFLVSSGAGVDADVCKMALTSKLKKFLNKIHLGSLTYGILTLKSLFTMKLADADVEFENGEKVHLNNTIFFAAMNTPFEGGGVPMRPDANCYDGLLSVLGVHDVSRVGCFLRFPSLLAAKHMNKKGFHGWDERKINVKFSNPMCVHADGEHCGFHKDLEFECMSGILRLRRK